MAIAPRAALQRRKGLGLQRAPALLCAGFQPAEKLRGHLADQEVAHDDIITAIASWLQSWQQALLALDR
jgi:hypothetical protein